MPKDKWNCPAVICAYNRPDYLDQCLKAVTAFPEVQSGDVPVYVFCDGGPSATIIENGKVIEKYPQVTYTYWQSDNLCIAKHIHHIRKTIFDDLNYDRMVFFEDDIVPSVYYYRYMNRALDIFSRRDETVGVVNSCSICVLPLAEKQVKRTVFSDSLSHLNNHVMLKRTWLAIKPTLQEYIDTFLPPGQNYRKINHAAVVAWASQKILNAKNISPQVRMDLTSRHLTSSQDSITNVAMRINNLRYLSSFVNRILNIGKVGFHYRAGDYERHGLDKVTLDVFQEDSRKVIEVRDWELYERHI